MALLFRTETTSSQREARNAWYKTGAPRRETSIDYEADVASPYYFDGRNVPTYSSFSDSSGLSFPTSAAEGWVQVGGNDWVFNVPPGSQFNPLQFRQLEIGANYNITFEASGNLNNNFIFRPGVLNNDVTINTAKTYSINFTAQNTNGWTRFLHTDVTGVTQVVLNNIIVSRR